MTVTGARRQLRQLLTTLALAKRKSQSWRAGACGDDMFIRFAFAATALAAATLPLSPSAFAQETGAAEPPPPPLFYSSAGLAWSGEGGLELEAGLQWQVGDALRLRLSPANVSLFDGDMPGDFYWDDDGFDTACREVATGAVTFDDECSPEPDTEWRSVAEAQFRIARGFHVGAGVSYILQGDFTQEDGRVAPFASFAWDLEDGMGFEVRAGAEYMALQLRGLW
jgi:hypothetical protein